MDCARSLKMNALQKQRAAGPPGHAKKAPARQLLQVHWLYYTVTGSAAIRVVP
jgi:hypothetical protein